VARSERRLLPVAAAILFIACGSLAGAALPLAVGFLAIAVALAIVDVFAGLVPMSIYVLNVATMIGLGVGIDYSLLMLRRFREELEREVAVDQAVARTVATAGSTVATSGLCVAVGFAGLLFTPLVETRSIGIGGLVVVAVAVALALTLLPALLAVLGTRVVPRGASELAARRLPVHGQDADDRKRGDWERDRPHLGRNRAESPWTTMSKVLPRTDTCLSIRRVIADGRTGRYTGRSPLSVIRSPV